jgi:hypothetical protein
LVYPAVLGLLNEYNQHGFSILDEIRTVPWISASQITSFMKKADKDKVIERSLEYIK